ncbi:MAG: toxin-antitoxin system YwqK family antitoxin [Kofleriaceae bacterium]
MGWWTRTFGRDRRPSGERAGELRGGEKHGAWIERDGRFLVERTYRDGVLHGPSRSWHPDGHLALEASYADGKLHGDWRRYDASGHLTAEREYRDGAIWQGQHELEGVLRGRYEAGHKVGLWEAWHHDKRVKERGTYVAGKRHGVFELGDPDRESWHGAFDMGERVGVWERRRYDGKLTAKGEYPRGARVAWTVENGTSRVEIEVATEAELTRWIALAELWLEDHAILDRDLAGWPDDERVRAIDWLEPLLATRPLPDEVDDGPAFEAAARDALVHATGDLAALAHPPAPPPLDDDAGDRVRWVPPRTGTMVVVGTLELPRRVIVASPEMLDVRRLYAFRAGTYELAAVDTGGRDDLPAAVVRLPGAQIARWRYLGEAHDSLYAVVAVVAALGPYPDAPGGASTPAACLVTARTGAGVWIINPSGNGIRAFAGVADDADIVAVFFQLY